MVISCVCDCRFLVLFRRTSIMVEGARVRLSGWQQAAVALVSAVGALVDPRRADLIADLGETTGKPAFERVLERMKRNHKGIEVLLYYWTVHVSSPTMWATHGTY